MVGGGRVAGEGRWAVADVARPNDAPEPAAPPPIDGISGMGNAIVGATNVDTVCARLCDGRCSTLDLARGRVVSGIPSPPAGPPPRPGCSHGLLKYSYAGGEYAGATPEGLGWREEADEEGALRSEVFKDSVRSTGNGLNSAVVGGAYRDELVFA